MKTKFFTNGLLICFFIACIAIAADVTGKWSGSVKGPDGNDYPLTYVFKADGDKLTGTSTTSFGESPIEKGKIDGDKISFSTSINGMEVPHTGKVMTDSIALVITYDGNPLTATIKRAK